MVLRSSFINELDETIAELINNLRTAHSLGRVDFFRPSPCPRLHEASRFLTEPLEEKHKYGANLKL